MHIINSMGPISMQEANSFPRNSPHFKQPAVFLSPLVPIKNHMDAVQIIASTLPNIHFSTVLQFSVFKLEKKFYTHIM
jgi:hypothetical protein